MLGLPSGQEVAKAMKIHNPLTPDEIATGTDGAVAKKHGLHLHTPLWYYILKEAEQRGNGERLGPVGATIVSEVFVGLVQGDRQSYLWRQGQALEAGAAVEDAGRFHHGRPAALRRRHQPDRRHHHDLESFWSWVLRKGPAKAGHYRGPAKAGHYRDRVRLR